MRKLINLCKKPFLIASAVLTVVALVALIVVCCVPHGGSYTYKGTQEMMGESYKVEMTYKFKGDKVEMISKMEGVDDAFTTEEYYVIKDGKLYVGESKDEAQAAAKLGLSDTKINSFKITMEGVDEAMTCGLNMGIMIASAIVAGLGALMTAFCVTILVLDRKGKLNA